MAVKYLKCGRSELRYTVSVKTHQISKTYYEKTEKQSQ